MIGLIIPPGQIKKLLQKTAEHVAMIGSQFEKILMQRQQNKPQFAFLKLDNPYRAYYDHKVAEVSKKLLQGQNVQVPKQQQKKQQQVQIQIKKKQQREVMVQQTTKQSQFLDKIFFSLKQPDPDRFSAQFPQKISQVQQAIIQHTAQYVAKNGRNFLIALSERQKNNPHYQFLRPNSKLHLYFTKITQSYTNILSLNQKDIFKLKQYIENKKNIFEKCKQIYQYYLVKQQQAKGKKQKKIQQTKQNNIDWNDFELVQTITFDDYKGLSTGQLVNRIQQMQPTSKTFQQKIINEVKKKQILQQCHVCRQNILASQMNKHLKTCLAQKNKKINQVSQTKGQQVDIRRNLQNLAAKRPDIFGRQQNAIINQQNQQKNQQKIIFDGMADNVSRTTGSIALMHYEQKRLRQQAQKRNK